jgi:hypothetical protein
VYGRGGECRGREKVGRFITERSGRGRVGAMVGASRSGDYHKDLVQTGHSESLHKIPTTNGKNVIFIKKYYKTVLRRNKMEH